jgi:hypothetical protein
MRALAFIRIGLGAAQALAITGSAATIDPAALRQDP